ncbi:MAG TPA: type IV pilin protein [Coxiellaceae bacterium]|nr:MAG: hypothetical protein A3E81_03370 [Gammaproteobacteria bacterium RIFCSPHIGHO2_12_FULL_36_30]HLB56360.1 type IV pilin protein [Coxiellaceae bacterium]
MRAQHAAFTLIELMLALAISVILITMGYPAYVHYQTRAERNRAEVALMQLSGKMENYFEENDSYIGATIDELNANHLVDGLHYQLAIADTTDSHYQIQAIPQDVQAARDVNCETLSLTDTNARSISGDGDVKQCWM